MGLAGPSDDAAGKGPGGRAGTVARGRLRKVADRPAEPVRYGGGSGDTPGHGDARSAGARGGRTGSRRASAWLLPEGGTTRRADNRAGTRPPTALNCFGPLAGA